MNLEDFYQDLPAIWLVFADSYLKHSTAPKESPDHREKLLVDLLRSFLSTQLSSPIWLEYDLLEDMHPLSAIQDLLELWSEDLKLIYQIREGFHSASYVARHFLQRIRTFEDCTIIPNGLISAGHKESYESISLAILKKRNSLVDWIQINPGGLYHQECPSVVGKKGNAYLEITGIDVKNITEDWLYLLIGLKAVRPLNNCYYKEVSLYECLLANLNGITTFRSQTDESFMYYFHTSPIHTWQVINESFRYLLQHFLGENYFVVYCKFLIDFKLFLIKKTFTAYQNKANKKIQQCHYLLQEMCRHMAQQTLEKGDLVQIEVALSLIDAIKASMKKLYSQQNKEACYSSHLNETRIISLCFAPPNVIKHSPLTGDSALPGLQVDPVFKKPETEEDIIDYIKILKREFIDKLSNSIELKEVALLSYGIEIFLIDHLAKTDILKKSSLPFSKDDIYLAEILVKIAEIYYGCQVMLKRLVSGTGYQPQFYTKNITVQFFVYAAIAALNFRDTNIGPLLSSYNLSTATSKSLTLDVIVPHLVIHDSRYLKVLLAVKDFFAYVKDKKVLFPHSVSQFYFRISNNADKNYTDVAFAYQLLQKYKVAYEHFVQTYRDLNDESLNKKWAALAYSNAYLPLLYRSLHKIAFLSKASFMGFQYNNVSSLFTSIWCFQSTQCWRKDERFECGGYYYWTSCAYFLINKWYVASKPNSSHQLMSYLLKSENDRYQRLIIRKENIGMAYSHFFENEIIASQDEKPATMDCIRYMHLGFLQSEPWIKLERLYIAIKDQQLDFSCEQESILIKQALFEVSVLKEKFCSLLEWTVICNSGLIHKVGLLCVEKALGMKYRLTQYPAISEILEVVLGLLTFYPEEYKDEFIEKIGHIYYMLKAVIDQPPTHLSENTLLHLNACLIISVQTKPQLTQTDALTVLKALLAIENYKIKGILIGSYLLLSIHMAGFIMFPWMEHQLEQNQVLLNDLMLSIIPQWDRTSLWKKHQTGLLFTCGNYTIKPMSGLIYFRNQPITGLPNTITEHRVYKEYLGKRRFSVIPGSRKIDTHEVVCYSSVDHELLIRLTEVRNNLLIEEWIDGNYQLYMPPQELLGHDKYPRLLYQLPHNNEVLRHWLANDKIFIKDQQRRSIYQWDLQTNSILSIQHQGYIIPWEQLQSSDFKTWLTQIEISDWIEIIAKEPYGSSIISFQSLHFPRLGLDFDDKQGFFYSRQIHGYYLAKQQYLNILQGFTNYLILEKKEKNSTNRLFKVVIPHRKVRLVGYFYSKSSVADLGTVRSPAYFVYDLDNKIGLLRANHIRAQLYLALLYYCSSSLDDNDISLCNSYHLARENLEICWKDQPYDKIEMDILEQFLSNDGKLQPATMRDYHSHRVALYLKVVFLLSSSLRLAFLYTDEIALKNKTRNLQLLNQSCNNLPHFFTVYLQNKSTISARIRLSVEEEKEILKYRSVSFTTYYQLHFENQSAVCLSEDSKTHYKRRYQELFTRENLNSTLFLNQFRAHIQCFSFTYDIKGLNFLSGIDGILIDRFRLMHFITLYKLAKSSVINITKYRYLLHHLVIRAFINHNFPYVLVMMLARSLLLIAERPRQFPEAPKWFNSYELSVDLSKRNLFQTEALAVFPKFVWNPTKTYTDYQEKIKAKETARKKDERENKRIWFFLALHDLDTQGIPLKLPENPNSFKLKYESKLQNVGLSDMFVAKINIVRKLYLQTARNDAMYKFFVSVLKTCDRLKYISNMGWFVSPCTDGIITMTVTEDELPKSPIRKVISLINEVMSRQPLVDLAQFFTVKQQSFESGDFLFEAQLNGSPNGYQRQFYNELKDSWVAYHSEMELNYHLLNTQAVKRLETYLLTKHAEISKQKEKIWSHIAKEFEQRPNSKSDHYFALRWYSGQVPHYHKGDLLNLLVEPHKLARYNPSCLQKKDIIIKDLLHYVNHEVDTAKIIRVLAYIEDYKQVKNESECFSLVQCLVKSLQENLDPSSYCYPHWFLFQLENNLIVRNNQRELILEMLNQTEKVMYQLNMGEGKSSVILPLLCYNFANGQQLLRINVLSSLFITMKDFLRQCFSGLIRKRVYTLPFCRDTDISTEHLTLILQALKTCQQDQHILLITPEHRMCLQLKIRELMIENQQQMTATDIFNWKTYRQRAYRKVEVYQDLTEEKAKQLLDKQDEHLKTCLYNAKYIDGNNQIIKVPPRGQGLKEFARFRDKINDPTLREWSCLKAAYHELLYNCKLAYGDSREKLALLNKISELTTFDVLDESDEILKHNTELNYTMGDKYVFSGGELRWQIPQFFIETIFCDPTVTNVITAGLIDGFTVINMRYSSIGGVPFIQLFDESYYEKHIKPLLVEKFFSEHLPSLRKYCINVDDPVFQGEISSVRHYVSGQLSSSTEKKMVASLAHTGSLKDKLLIAKGWLSHGILFHVFNAKYRVQYGLAMDLQGQVQKQIAIPFWGKDMPSPRAEFSHPDVMLGFTIISYLYQGLNHQQLKQTLIRLKNKFDHQVADSYLKNWTETSRTWIESQTDIFPPLLLNSFENLDLVDEQCLQKVHQYLSGNHPAIFFYLNQFVLIEEAMQYLYKISANAHSLVGYNAALGFSGTDDRKLTMPFQIKSLRSMSQQGTNGKLLSVLAEQRNRRYYSLQIDDTNDLLKQLCHYMEVEPHCHALIDAGALVTGLTNHEVASFLMRKLPSIFLGILYFSDEGNNLTVLTRDGKSVALQDCYLDKQHLFAYLDDVHTRGTDIRLPLNCHAILTIGMGMQKDKLMQAAMRLRQLAKTQSVSLWGTHAVTLAIARDNQIDVNMINSLEVIKWVTHNTINRINTDLFPVALRKISFQFLQKAEAWLAEAPTTINILIQYCQDKELFRLEEFYALSPQREDLGDRLYCIVAARIKTFWEDLEQEFISKELIHTPLYNKIFSKYSKEDFRAQLYTICNELAVYLQFGYVHNSLDNDQEKEVEVEVEIIQEQQVLIKREKRDIYLEKQWDSQLILREDFVPFAEKQNIIMKIRAIRHFVQEPVNLKNIIWHDDIYMTANFINTVQSKANEVFDNYLRPIDVVLIHRLGAESVAILLSGQEASQIKSKCYTKLDNNLLVHIKDIDGPTKLPIGSILSKQEQKLLTVIKLFSGECQYTSPKEIKRLSKRVGRIYPHYFTSSEVSVDISQKLYGSLIEKGYLDFAGIMTEKLLNVFAQLKAGESVKLSLTSENDPHSQYVMRKLHRIYDKLIIHSSSSLRSNHYILCQWIGTRRRQKEYEGSELESVLNSEYHLKC